MNAEPLTPVAWHLIVVGTPAPQGSKRHVGRGKMIESSNKVAPWREAIRNEAAAIRPETPMEGPLDVQMGFTLTRPKSRPRKDNWPDRRPDIDKLVRSTLDALGMAGVYVDDAQVCFLGVWKRYVGDPAAMTAPGVTLTVRQLAAVTT